jgi:hypothetical protein
MAGFPDQGAGEASSPLPPTAVASQLPGAQNQLANSGSSPAWTARSTSALASLYSDM